MENDFIYKVNKPVYERILADKTIPSGAKVVLSNLIYRSGLKDYAFPSQRRIAKDVGLSDRQVRNHLRLLFRREIITWSKGAVNPKTGTRFNSNKYDLTYVLQRVKKLTRK